MHFVLKATSILSAAALLGMVSMSVAVPAERPASPVEAEFRGCESAGWCRFRIDSADPSAAVLYRVRPDGIARIPVENAMSTAMRNRLNALLSNMIHQAKHIVLDDLRRLEDGTYAATVTINGANLARDAMVVELQKQAAGKTR
jgi:hypothetical protein